MNNLHKYLLQELIDNLLLSMITDDLYLLREIQQTETSKLYLYTNNTDYLAIVESSDNTMACVVPAERVESLLNS